MRRWLDGDAAKQGAPQQDRRSTGLSAEPVVGTDGVSWRSKNSDRQCPIGTDHSATHRRSQQLAVSRPSPGGAGRLQLYSVVSSAHRHHLVIDDYLEDVLQTGRRAAEPSADLEPGAPYLLTFCRTAGPVIPILCGKVVSRIGRWSSRESVGGARGLGRSPSPPKWRPHSHCPPHSFALSAPRSPPFASHA